MEYHSKNRNSILVKRKAYHYIRNYGISLEELDNWKERVKNVCSICSKNSELVIDHCHGTGRIRGLLCNKCNQGLGSFNDDPNIMKNAIKYLNGETDEIYKISIC